MMQSEINYMAWITNRKIHIFVKELAYFSEWWKTYGVEKNKYLANELQTERNT